MDLIDRLRDISSRIPKVIDRLQTEEACKNALVMPFIQALGYDVFDPSEVVPEFTADVGVKKGEKVDYAIMQGAEPSILFECKGSSVNLDNAHASQLFRYFSVTPARFGVLTNGIHYRIFSDLEAPNKMDSRPFFEFNLLSVTEKIADELKKFHKDAFDVEEILSTASDLKYAKGIKRAFAEEWINPSEEFVRIFTSRVYSGRLTTSVKEQFAEITKRAFQEFVNDKINERLKSAMEGRATALEESKADDSPDPEDRTVVTTQEEIEGYYTIKSILRETIDVSRVYMRDTHSYCGILLDDNNRKPICRLRFNALTKKYVGIFDAEKSENRHEIDSVNDLYRFADELKATTLRYDNSVG